LPGGSFSARESKSRWCLSIGALSTQESKGLWCLSGGASQTSASSSSTLVRLPFSLESSRAWASMHSDTRAKARLLLRASARSAFAKRLANNFWKWAVLAGSEMLPILPPGCCGALSQELRGKAQMERSRS